MLGELEEDANHDFRSLCLTIQECNTVDQLAELAVKKLGELFGAVETHWIEVEKVSHRILWSCAYSGSTNHDELNQNSAGFKKISSLKEAFQEYLYQESVSDILLSKIIAESEPECAAYYRDYMQPSGVREVLGLSVYHSENGAAWLALSLQEQELSPVDRKDLGYIRDHLRIAYKKLVRMGSCSNLIKALQETRKEGCLAGVSVISGDGSRLWDVDETSEMIITRTGAGKKIHRDWVLMSELAQWIKEVIESQVRLISREKVYTRNLGARGNELTASIYLESVGKGGLLVCSSRDIPSKDKKVDLALGGFTRRESEIAELMLADESSMEIAEALKISKRTVEKHLENIYFKLGVRNRLAAIKKLRASGH